MRQRLIHLPLIEESFFRLERPRVDDPDLLAVRPIHAEDPDAAGRHAQVEKPRLHRKPRRIRQQPDRKRIFKRFFYFSLRQRTIGIEGRIVPIKLHIGFNCILNAHAMSLHCIYTLA